MELGASCRRAESCVGRVSLVRHGIVEAAFGSTASDAETVDI
jgi:hypothetical protein